MLDHSLRTSIDLGISAHTEVYTPTGFIFDVDYPEDLNTIKQHMDTWKE